MANYVPPSRFGSWMAGDDEDYTHSGLQDSVGTLKAYQPAGYSISENGSMLSAARGSLTSSSQYHSVSYGPPTTSDTSAGPAEQEQLPSYPDHPITADVRQDFSYIGEFTANELLKHPTGGDVLSETPLNAATQPLAGKRPATNSPPIDTHEHNENIHKIFKARDYLNEQIDLWAEDPDSQQASLVQEAYGSLGEKLKPALHYDDRDRDENTANASDEHCVCAMCSAHFKKRGTLARHLSDKHFPQVKFMCLKPDCKTMMNRRDRMLNHVRCHNGDSIQYGFKDIELACPAKCPLCPKITDSWKSFYDCIISHPTNEQPRRIAAARTNRSSHIQRQPKSESRGVERGNTPSKFPGPMANTGGRATRDGQTIQRRPRTRGTPRNDPYTNQQQAADMLRWGRFIERQSSSANLQDPSCDICHQALCYSPSCYLTSFFRLHCHACLDRQPSGPLAVSTTVQNPQLPGPQSPLGTNLVEPEFYVDPRQLTQALNNNTMPPVQTGQGLPDFTHNQFGNDVDSVLDNSEPHYPIWFLRQPEPPNLSEKQLACQWSSNSFISKMPKASTLADALPWTSEDTDKDLVGMLSKLSMGLPTPPASPTMPSNEISTELSPWEDIPQPMLSQCKCACNNVSKNAAARFTADLSGGRRLEMTVVPNSAGSTLRNKVQIVVRLLSLREATKKKRAEAKQVIEGVATTAGDDRDDDKDDDDDDGEDKSNIELAHSRSFDYSSTDMSLYEDQDTLSSYLPELELTFDVDPQFPMERISQWTAGFLDHDHWNNSYKSQLMDMNPNRLFEKIIRQVAFIIWVLGHGCAAHETRFDDE